MIEWLQSQVNYLKKVNSYEQTQVRELKKQIASLQADIDFLTFREKKIPHRIENQKIRRINYDQQKRIRAIKPRR